MPDQNYTYISKTLDEREIHARFMAAALEGTLMAETSEAMRITLNSMAEERGMKDTEIVIERAKKYADAALDAWKKRWNIR